MGLLLLVFIPVGVSTGAIEKTLCSVITKAAAWPMRFGIVNSLSALPVIESC